jgi:hypothetical protein
MDEIGDPGEPLIGHGDHAGVGFDGAEGIIRGLRFGRGEGVEDGALADIGQADDSAIQWHWTFLFFSLNHGGCRFGLSTCICGRVAMSGRPLETGFCKTR